MAEEQPEHVTRDQHRADMVEVRLELKTEIAGLRQEMTALRGELKPEIVSVRQELKEEIAGVRQDVAVMAKTVESMQQTMLLRFEQVDRQLVQHDARLLSLENWMRATFVTVALVAVGVAVQLVYIMMRLGFKPPTP
jgi:hypothetical protein